LARALEGEDSLRSTAAILCEFFQAEPALERFVSSLDPAALEQQVQTLMKGVFDGADWPGINVERSLVESHFPSVRAALWDTMRGPLPLGEDTLVAALEKLSEQTGSSQDPRLASFFEAIRDLIFFSSTPVRRNISKGPVKVTIEALTGRWKSSDGQLHVVTGKTCTFPGNDTKSLSTENGAIVMNGWTVTSMTGKAVVWQKSGKKMEWRREQSKPKDSVAERPSPGEISRVPDGLWQNSEGVLCTVHQGACTSLTRGSQAITSQNGVAVLDGWRVVSVSPASVKWERSGHRMEWCRYENVRDVIALVGVWKNSDGLMCIVAEGECNFIPRGAPGLTLKDGILSLNDWVATAITEKEVSWQKFSQSMRWERIERIEEIQALNGAWKTSDGLSCNVKAGSCTFLNPAGTHSLAMKDGLPALNAWQAVAIRAQSVSWRRGSKTLEWQRETPAS